MPYLIGTDEAGYGPNLGPLIISASAWWVPESPDDVDLFARLKEVVCSEIPRDDDRRIAIADSKSLYKPGRGVAALERGVLAALDVLEHQPGVWRELWEALAGDCGAHRQSLPWYENYTLRLPTDLTSDEVQQASENLRRGLASAGVRLVALKSVAVFPDQFNRLVAQYDSKGAALTRMTLELLDDVLSVINDEPALVVCDKHGGRNRYAAQLQEHFPDYLVEIYGESRAASTYRWGPPDCRVEVRFQSKGERFLPAALASMASKYLRELAMRAFNDFWCEEIADLKRTAGYPLDARRFKSDIANAQKTLGIDDQIIWRAR